MKWTLGFSFFLWLLSCLFGSTLMVLVTMVSEGDVSEFPIAIFFILFISLTRSLPAMLVFMFIGAVVDRYAISKKMLAVIQILIAMILGFTNMFLFLARNKPAEFFSADYLIATIPFIAGVPVAWLVLYRIQKRREMMEKMNEEKIISAE